MTQSKEFYLGCFFGLALGDALCAPYEGGILERLLWLLIGKTTNGKRRYTDDTQMSMDVAFSLLKNKEVNQNDLAQQFAHSYRWSRGYGIGATKILKRIKKGASWQEVNRRIFSQGSYGNGAAMRAPIVALYFNNYPMDSLLTAVKQVSEITHAHFLAIEGANLIALAVSDALAHKKPKIQPRNVDKTYQIRLNMAQIWLESGEDITPKKVSKQLGNGIAAIDSCVTAIYIASRYLNQDFLVMLDFIKKCGGDTDTIGAMAGAIWGAYNGIKKIDPLLIEQLESAPKIHQLAVQIQSQKNF